MVDLKLINHKLIMLMQLKKELLNYNIKSFDKFKINHKDQKAVEKTLQEMIEICMDIGKHIISDEGFRIPEDSKDIFRILNENKIIPKRLTSLMYNMVGFRNIIVHMYDKIDLSIVYGVYSKHLDDFDRFAKEIDNHYKIQKY